MFFIVYIPNNPAPVAVFDIKAKRFKANRLGLGLGGNLPIDIAHHEAYGYRASVADLTKLPRNTRGNVEAKAFPVRLDTESLQAAFVAALKPRRRKAGEPARALRGGLTEANRHQRAKLVTDDMLERTSVLRADGLAWKAIAASLGVNFESLKTARKRASGEALAA